MHGTHGHVRLSKAYAAGFDDEISCYRLLVLTTRSVLINGADGENETIVATGACGFDRRSRRRKRNDRRSPGQFDKARQGCSFSYESCFCARLVTCTLFFGCMKKTDEAE